MENRASGCDPIHLHTAIRDHLAYLGSSEFIRDTSETLKVLLSECNTKNPPDGVPKSDKDFVADLSQQFKVEVGSATVSYAMWKKNIRELKILYERIQEIPCLALMHLDEVESLFSDYKATFSQTITKSFMDNTGSENRGADRTGFIKSYVESIGEFIEPEVLEKLIDSASSRSIGANGPSKEMSASALTEENLDDEGEDEEDGASVYEGINFQDLARVNINQVYKYDNKLHFRDTIKQYQGLQQKTIPDAVVEDVKKMIKLQGLENPDPDKYVRVTKDHVRKFLVATKHNSYYEDIQLIYGKITGKPCPNISAFEPILYKEFDELVEAFKKLKLKRTNFLNCHYVLKQLLKRQKYRVPEGDLPCLKTPNRLREHHGIYQKCCEILGWTFSPN